MACSIVIRRHEGFQSYLVLDDNPRELLRHVGFADQFSVRPWLGSIDPQDALEEWVGRYPDNSVDVNPKDDPVAVDKPNHAHNCISCKRQK